MLSRGVADRASVSLLDHQPATAAVKMLYTKGFLQVSDRALYMHAGPGELPGLTDEDKPRLRGPKRASKIRKLFNLTKEDDVRKYVNTYRRKFEGKDGKSHSKAPKIQRLVTPLTLQRKRRRASLKRQAHEKVHPSWLHTYAHTDHGRARTTHLAFNTMCFAHAGQVSSLMHVIFCVAHKPSRMPWVQCI